MPHYAVTTAADDIQGYANQPWEKIVVDRRARARGCFKWAVTTHGKAAVKNMNLMGRTQFLVSRCWRFNGGLY